MVQRIECTYCQKRLAGEKLLQRHIQTIHKLELIINEVKN